MRNFSFHARFYSGIALAGLTIGIPLAVAVQAQPSNLTYEYQDGSFTAEAEINPLAGRLLGRVLKKEIPSAVTFSATELAGSFTLPATSAKLGNDRITLDSSPVKAFLEPYLQQAMGRVAQSYNLPKDVDIETLEAVLNYRFIGQGRINSANNSTAFTFEYGDDTDSLTIKGIDPAVLALCQLQQCNTQVDGDFDLKLDVEGFSKTSNELGIQLPSSVRQALKQAQFFGLKEVAFADGQLTSVVQVLPSLAPSTTPGEAVVPGATVPTQNLARSPQVVPGIAKVQAPAQTPMRPQRSMVTAHGLHQITHGNFVLTAERLTAPWSMVFAVPSR